MRKVVQNTNHLYAIFFLHNIDFQHKCVEFVWTHDVNKYYIKVYVINEIIMTDVIDYHFGSDNVTGSVHTAVIAIEYVYWRCARLRHGTDTSQSSNIIQRLHTKSSYLFNQII